MTNTEDHRSIEPPKQQGRQPWFSQSAPQSRSNDAEIPPGEWASFLESFSQQHEGWLASISVSSAGRRSVRVSNCRFTQITIAQEGEQHHFRISVEGNRGDHLVHEVTNPLRLTFKQDLRGAHAGLDITSADDSVTTLRFRVAAHPETLDGVLAQVNHSEAP